ncbi:class I SAM-dependent methyltransferase [soil metagenome]
MADHLTRHLASMAPHRAILRAVECRLMGEVDLVAPVLDVGCGDGHFASIAYRSPIDVGVDVRHEELVEARARGAEVYRSVAKAGATELPFADGAFATVVSNCVIEHIEDNQAVLSEVARVLRPGGTFATTLPSEHFAPMLLGSTVLRRLHLHRASKAYGRFFNRISHHHHVHDAAEWRRRFAAVGLDVEVHEYYFSAAAHRAFDLSHYLGVPNLVTRGLTGRWVLHPRQLRPFDRWLRRYYEEPLPQPVGAYQFVVCRRR